MNIFKALFGGKEETREERRKEEEARNFDVLKYDGVKALKMRQPAYAVQCLTHALELKDDLECRDYLSQALIQNNELPKAYEQLQKLAEAQPDNTRILMRMAEVAYMMEDYNVMADACERALMIDNENPLTFFFYARACRGQGDDNNAVAMLTKAISLKDDYYDAYLLRGEILLETGEVDNADEDAAYLCEHVADNEDILLLKAKIEMAKGNYDQAIDIYNKVIDLNPFCATAFRERGKAKMAAGDASGAEEDMKTAEEFESDLNKDGDEKKEDMEQKVNQIYKNNDPYGIFSGN